MPTHSQITRMCLLNGKASLVRFLYSVSQWRIPPPHVGPSTAAAITPHLFWNRTSHCCAGWLGTHIVWPRLAFTLWHSLCLTLLITGITGVSHYTQLLNFIIKCLFSQCLCCDFGNQVLGWFQCLLLEVQTGLSLYLPRLSFMYEQPTLWKMYASCGSVGPRISLPSTYSQHRSVLT